MENRIRSISFPAISAGVYSYPLKEVADVGLGTAHSFLKEHGEIELIRFVLFGDRIFRIFKEMFERF